MWLENDKYNRTELSTFIPILFHYIVFLEDFNSHKN